MNEIYTNETHSEFLLFLIGDILKWFILNSVIVIPFTCAFWITFGAGSLHPVEGYETVGALSYNMFSMMVVGDHNFNGLLRENPFLARLLCGSFIGTVMFTFLSPFSPSFVNRYFYCNVHLL